MAPPLPDNAPARGLPPLQQEQEGQSFSAARECEGQSFIAARAHNFGSKSIGMFASVALLVNNITGPGVPGLANMFVESGWLFPVITIIAIWAMTSLSAAMFCEAMRKIPGNEHFRDRVEYTTIVDYYFGRKWYIAAQVGLNGALQSLNIISVVQSAQVMDNLISVIFGKTCALNLSPFQSIWTDPAGMNHNVAGSTDIFSCINTNHLDAGNAWGCHVVLTAGFLVTAAMAIPCGRWNLDDNMYIQVVCFVLTIACWAIWMIAGFTAFDGPESAGIPAINTDPNTGSQAGVLGVILFNFGFVTAVPSWINEKRPHVSTNKALWLSTTICIIVFFCVGLPAAIGFSDVLQGPVSGTCARQTTDQSFNCANDVLQVITDSPLTPAAWQSGVGRFVLKASVFLFPIVAVVSSIPIFSIVIKYNMIENGFSQPVSFFWGVLFPWLVGFPLLYMPNILSQFINFTSLVFVSFTDFIVPWALYIKLQNGRVSETGVAEDGSFLCEAEQEINIHAHYAISRRLRVSANTKRCVSIVLMFVLAIAAAVATVLTVVQGTYAMNLQVCALVGS